MSESLTANARELRNNLTDAEKHLWYALRGKTLGVKFRRQTVIGRYIVDFVCYEKKLVIEVDGGQHAGNDVDVIRDEWLRSEGFAVLRFWNHDVLGNRDGVVQRIYRCLYPLPVPPQSAEAPGCRSFMASHKGEG